MNKEEIIKNSLIKAIGFLKKNKWSAPNNSRDYDVLYEGERFPPKQVLSKGFDIIYEEYPEIELPNINGGIPTNNFLEKHGLNVIEKIKFITPADLIAQYKLIVANGNPKEVYKWELINEFKGRPSLSEENFAVEVEAVKYKNLVYHNALAVRSTIVKAKPDEYRKAYRLLFDEKIDLISRVIAFQQAIKELYTSLGYTLGHHHDERTIATVLAFYKPDEYPLYKNSFYEKYCKLIGIKSGAKDEKYAHYIGMLNFFINDYIVNDKELLQLKQQFLNSNSYPDNQNLILAQDILYQTLDGQTEDGEEELANMNYKEKFKQWLEERTSKGSGKVNSYITAITILSELLEKNVFEIADLNYLAELYQDLINNQKNESGKYFYPKSKSYGEKGYYSAAINEYSLFHRSLLSLSNLTMKFPLNQILYGPPGTGKTYHTINRALSIIENRSDDDLALETREALKERYQAYVANGQIVFTSFHQSMSYEDFVEGIKPEIEEDKEGLRSVVYDVKDGIFKALCTKAKVSSVKEEQPVVYQFDEAWNDLLDEVQATEDAMDDFILDILTPKRGLKVTEVTDQGNLRLTPISVAGLDYTVSYTRAKKLQAAFPDLSLVKNIDKEFRAVIGGSNSTAYWAVINNLNKKITKNQSVVEVATTALKPHVLIIDEINRGNVSAIFGELITLIEDSKRAGASEALELTLPYSKEKFSVPSNLYIIGTMNTADRSVEALDTALRRRFAFEEMMPEPSKITTDGALAASAGVLEGVDLAQVLTKINERIAILLDVDHQIGHSYLINVSDTHSLANAFNNCILPLLKEYFYHDDEKIALVLGAGFVQVKAQTNNIQALFPAMDGLEVHSIDSKQQFELKPIKPDTIITALQSLLNGD